MKLLTIVLLMCTVYRSSTAPEGNVCSKIPNDANPIDCCPTPVIVSMDIYKECFIIYGEMQKKKDALPGPKRGWCTADCVTEKLGVNPKGNGNIDRGIFKTKLQQAMNGDANYITTLNNAFDNCFAKADAKAAEFQEAKKLKPAFHGEKMCHPISGYVLNCIGNEMFINCPTKIWKSSGECNAIKEYVKKCETIPNYPEPVRR